MTASSERRDWSQETTTVTKARLLYSTSVLEHATTDCFLDHQEMRFGPKKTQAPEVDRLSSGSEAQSAPQKAVTEKGAEAGFSQHLKVHNEVMKTVSTNHRLLTKNIVNSIYRERERDLKSNRQLALYVTN